MQDSRVIYGGGYPEMQMAKVLLAFPLQADGKTMSDTVHSLGHWPARLLSYSLSLAVMSIVHCAVCAAWFSMICLVVQWDLIWSTKL